jgi:Zn-finger nucleic acid-binding protein
MKCPKCITADLVRRRIRGKKLTLDYCPKCLGIWFDSGELEQILSEAIKKLSVPNNASKVSYLCPRCQRRLYEFYYPQTLVLIDMCQNCSGIWFDNKKEIEEIHLLRKHLKDAGTLKEYDDVPGIKGFLINFVNTKIESLKESSKWQQ